MVAGFGRFLGDKDLAIAQASGVAAVVVDEVAVVALLDALVEDAVAADGVVAGVGAAEEELRPGAQAAPRFARSRGRG